MENAYLKSMKGSTKYNKVSANSIKENVKLLKEKKAIPVFTMFLAPVDLKDKKSEEMWFGYTISGDAVIGMGTLLEQLEGIIAQIKTDLIK